MKGWQPEIEALLAKLPAGSSVTIALFAQWTEGYQKHPHEAGVVIDELSDAADNATREIKLAQRIRNERRAIMPDAARDTPRRKAKHGKECPKCHEIVGPRTKECMCGQKFASA